MRAPAGRGKGRRALSALPPAAGSGRAAGGCLRAPTRRDQLPPRLLPQGYAAFARLMGDESEEMQRLVAELSIVQVSGSAGEGEHGSTAPGWLQP